MSRSFRLSNTGQVVGRVVQDRETAILGRLGEQAPTFPCTVDVKGAVEEHYDYRVAGYWEVAPQLAFLIAAESSARWEGEGNRCTLDARAEIRLSGRREPLVLRNTYAGYSVLPPSLDLVEMPNLPRSLISMAGLKYVPSLIKTPLVFFFIG